MGKVGETMFGGPEKSKSSSRNLAYGDISEAMQPNLRFTGQAGNTMGDILGLNGDSAQTGGLERFANSGGMKFLQEQGNEQINANQAAKGLLNSGSTLKELTKYGQGLGSTYLSKYMESLNGLGTLGLGSAGALAGAGNVSQSKSRGKKEGALSMAAKSLAASQGMPVGGM